MAPGGWVLHLGLDFWLSDCFVDSFFMRDVCIHGFYIYGTNITVFLAVCFSLVSIIS